MGLTLQIFLLVVILFFIGVILNLLRKGTLTLKYSLVWILSGIVLSVMVIIPDTIKIVANLVGIKIASNFVFLTEGIFVVLILISLTIIVSKQKSRIIK